VAELKPDGCIHLAGIAFVPQGWSDPDLVFAVNLGGSVNILEALRAEAASARVLVVTSAEVYGRRPAPHPLREDAPLEPSNLYAVSKLAADLTALLYARRYGMHVMTARPQNHIGPGQSSQFVAQSFAEQLAALKEQPGEPVIRVGNLDSCRDFTDVRDVARAYRRLLEDGRSGEAYNIASGRGVRVRELLDHLCTESGVTPRIETDPDRYRPTDDPPMLDITKIREHTGWQPEIALSQTLKDVYADVQSRRANGS
jgi:GDP-4-dehydro-6-deoxy-D-mannose reductase